MLQTWHDLLFAHWPVAPGPLRALLPPGLLLDEFEGQAFVGVVPFRMGGIRLRGLPPLPGLSAFPEINLRTYVVHAGRPGVFFLSLDAAHVVAVWAARRFFHLPYYLASIRSAPDGDGVGYSARRIHRGFPALEFRARYRPRGPAALAPAGSLEHWLTERYSLYTAGPGGGLETGEILHEPWPLQPAEAEIERNDLATPFGVTLAGQPPLLHFARRLPVRLWGLAQVPS